MTGVEHTVRIVIEHVDAEAAEQRRLAAEEIERAEGEERLRQQVDMAEFRASLRARTDARGANAHHRRAWRRRTMRDLAYAVLGSAVTLLLVGLAGGLA
jgi:hypothetical protein